jgi:hypothetical protein
MSGGNNLGMEVSADLAHLIAFPLVLDHYGFEELFLSNSPGNLHINLSYSSWSSTGLVFCEDFASWKRQ